MLKIKSPNELWWQNWSDIDLDLFIQCIKDVGGTITPGTGKIFINEEEIDLHSLIEEFQRKD